MANKYSKYELRPFMDMYVDTGVKEISKILSERYDKNKSKKDLVEQTLGSMEALEGDQHLIDRVKYKIQDDLKDIARNGNWEDATHVIDQAIIDVQTDDGLLAAKKSMENRQAELEFIKKQTMEGKKVLDFGKTKASEHSSYVYNEETSKWEDNIYQAGAETRLDYESKMGDLLKTIKADASGVSQSKADGIAKGLYYTYSQSDEGQQDLRRLMYLEYDQNIPEEERYMMAQKDIIRRIKGFTNQYVHSTGKAAPGTSSIALLQKYQNISPAATDAPFTASDIDGLLESDWSTPRLLDLQTKTMDALKAGDTKRARDLQEIYESTIMSMVKKGDLTKEEAELARHYEINMWAGDNKGHDKAFGHFVKYLTDDRIMPDFYLSKDVEWGTLATGTASSGVGAWAGGKGVGWVGKKLGVEAIKGFGKGMVRGAWPLALGAAVGYLGYKGIKSVFDYGNVRDSLRSEKGEKKQLLKTVEDIAFVNKHLGTAYTESDIPRLKLMAEQYYDYKVGDAEGTSDRYNGDGISNKFNDYQGDVYEANSYTMSFSKEGKAASNNVNTIMAHHNVNMDNFRIVGVPDSSEEYAKYTEDEDGEKATGAIKFNRLLAPSLMHNAPTRMVITTPNGRTAIVEAKEGADTPLFGLMESVADELGLGMINVMENVVDQLGNKPGVTYKQVANAAMQSIVKIAQIDPMDAATQEAAFKSTLRTLYFTIPEVNTLVEEKIDIYEKSVQRKITQEEQYRLIDLFLFDPNNGLIVNNNVYR